MVPDPLPVPSPSSEVAALLSAARRLAAELDGLRAELTTLQPSAWRSQAARAFDAAVHDSVTGVVRGQTELDDAISRLPAS